MTALEILERTFRPVNELPGAAAGGVYLLILSGVVVYVGSSQDVRRRIGTHRSGVEVRHLGACHKPFDRALWIPLKRRQFASYEGALIRALDPIHNRFAPKYRGLDNRILERLGLPPIADTRAAVKRWIDRGYASRRYSQESA